MTSFISVKDKPYLVESNRTIVCPNKRLALETTRALDQFHMNRGDESWENPKCLSLDDFFISEYNAYAADFGVKTSIISESKLTYYLMKTAPLSLAKFSKRTAAAIRLIIAYKIPLSQISHTEIGEDSFVDWINHALENRGNTEILAEEIPRLLEEASYAPKKGILLNNIEQLTADQLSYFSAMREKTPVFFVHQQDVPRKFNGSIDMSVTKKGLTPYSVREFDTIFSEIAAAADWAKRRLASNPNARIGIVAPRLSSMYEIFARQFGATLEPLRGSMSSRFNISGGVPLKNESIWKNLKSLVRLITGPIKSFQAREIAYSLAAYRNWFNEAAYTDRGRDRRLIPAEEIFSELIPRRITKALENRQKDHPLSVWLELFGEVATCLFQNSASKFGSRQFQANETLTDCIQVYQAQLQSEKKPIPLFKAWLFLEDMIEETTLSLERSQSPIQILGMLETTGLDFTDLWICGMEHENFPSAVSANLLLPSKTRREYGLPRSSPQQELDFAQARINSWLASSENTIFSFARDTEISKDNSLTTLLSKQNTVVHEPIARKTINPFFSSHGIEMERYTDEHGNSIQEPLLKGGTRRLSVHQECNFKSFAEFQLKLRPIEEVPLLTGPLERGTMLHEILHALRSEKESTADYLEITSDSIRLFCQKIVGTHDQLPDSFRKAEINRLSAIIESFLELERSRLPFKTMALEKKFILELDDIQIEIRVDRIDSVEKGMFVFDYKSSNRSISQGSIATPRDLQLPAYSLIEGKVNGVFYVNLTSEGPNISGVSQDPLSDTENSDIKTHIPQRGWIKQREEWRTTIKAIGESIKRGDAIVGGGARECEDCSFKGLCRIQELRQP